MLVIQSFKIPIGDSPAQLSQSTLIVSKIGRKPPNTDCHLRFSDCNIFQFDIIGNSFDSSNRKVLLRLSRI